MHTSSQSNTKEVEQEEDQTKVPQSTGTQPVLQSVSYIPAFSWNFLSSNIQQRTPLSLGTKLQHTAHLQ